MRKSSRGNPWHDERGRFCHGPVAKTDSRGEEITNEQRREMVLSSERTKEEYEERTKERVHREAVRMTEEMKSHPVNDSWKEKVEELHTIMEKDPEYHKECELRRQLAFAHNDEATELRHLCNDYDKSMDLRSPIDPGDMVARADACRERYEVYMLQHKLMEDKEQNLYELKEYAAGGDPFYNDPYHIANRPYPSPTTLPYIDGHKRNGFKDSVTDRDSREFHMAMTTGANLRDEPEEDTRKRFDELMAGREFTHENVSSAFRTLYTEKPFSKRTRPFISLDLETNSLSPSHGEIIEFGAIEVSPEGKELSSHENLYGLSPAQMSVNGTGAEHVHHISQDMIMGKPEFKTDAQNCLEYMKKGTVVVHNKSFELNWFRQTIPGFIEAEQKGEIRVVDTMYICRTMCETERNRLQSFVEHTGGKYENAHRSTDDARMTIEALFRWMESQS